MNICSVKSNGPGYTKGDNFLIPSPNLKTFTKLIGYQCVKIFNLASLTGPVAKRYRGCFDSMGSVSKTFTITVLSVYIYFVGTCIIIPPAYEVYRGYIGFVFSVSVCVCVCVCVCV